MSLKFLNPPFYILGLALVLGQLSSVSATPLTQSELVELNSRLSLSTEFHELACPASEGGSSDKIFLFDGALGFCPRFFILNAPDAHHETFTARLAETAENHDNQELLRSIRAKFEDEAHLKNCLLIKTMLKDDRRAVNRTSRQILYYSKNGNREAIDCAKKLLNSGSARALSIRGIGYSMGGHAVLQFAQGLAKESIPIEQVLSVDPVGKDMNWTTGVVGVSNNPIFAKSENAQSWLNFYQKFDRNCLVSKPWSHVGIRGSLVRGADLNYQMKRDDFVSERDADFGHVHILAQPIVKEALKRAFE